MKSQPQRTMALALLLTLAGALLATKGSAQSATPEQQDRFQRSFAIAPSGTLSVDNYKGSVKITAANTNQVVINVSKHFDGSESERKWWMENTKIEFSNSADHVDVQVKYPNRVCVMCWDENYSGWVDLEIQTPKQINLTLKGYKDEVAVSAVHGDIRISSYKSPIRIEDTTGAIRIDTYKDIIKLQRVAVRGVLEVKSYKADAEIDAASLGDSASIENSKGSIRLRVPKDTGMDVDFSGGRGSSFHSDFPLSASAGGFGREVRGTINQGGTHLRLRTDKGSVSIERTTGQI